MFTLYYAVNTCSLATHIALEDAGADYELRRIDFARTEQQSPDYLKVNPKARVPALVTPSGILTETPAMLAFIAQSFLEAALAPLDDAFAFAEMQSFNSYCALPFTSLTPIECVGTGGHMRPLPLPTCNVKCRSRSALVTI
jgi:glutathione S-transferase